MIKKEKKHNQKFTLSFDFSDPEMKEVIKKLNSLGERQKARYVAKAVMQYMKQEKRINEKPTDLEPKPENKSKDNQEITEESKKVIRSMLEMFKR